MQFATLYGTTHYHKPGQIQCCQLLLQATGRSSSKVLVRGGFSHYNFYLASGRYCYCGLYSSPSLWQLLRRPGAAPLLGLRVEVVARGLSPAAPAGLHLYQPTQSEIKDPVHPVCCLWWMQRSWKTSGVYIYIAESFGFQQKLATFWASEAEKTHQRCFILTLIL